MNFSSRSVMLAEILSLLGMLAETLSLLGKHDGEPAQWPSFRGYAY